MFSVQSSGIKPTVRIGIEDAINDSGDLQSSMLPVEPGQSLQLASEDNSPAIRQFMAPRAGVDAQ